MVDRVGVEPTTNRLKADCSTTELPIRYVEHSIKTLTSSNKFFKKLTEMITSQFLFDWGNLHRGMLPTRRQSIE